ncbi:LysM peptidoglycan-binding domain-containing protein [Candidatus Bathyarchaeota archaeon]|nr:LysM peptidoglycan-binding domain-containing protein [Candidatus Bathyarchaeota archaeon]
MVDNCNEFYYVEKGTDCADIAAENGISLSDFVSW